MERRIFENQDDAMMGLLAGITTIMEILVGKEVTAKESLDKGLVMLRSDFEEKKMSDAVVMIELMLRPLRDPVRANARILLNTPPEGQG